MKKKLITGIIGITLFTQPLLGANVYANALDVKTNVLKVGMSGSSIKDLQYHLNKAGYLNHEPTGYYGELTKKAVVKLQTDNNLQRDGIVGKKTYGLLSKLHSDTSVSRSQTRKVPIGKWTWFGKINKIIPRGTIYTITDIQTGKSFKVKRTYGTNHADSETLTKADTKIMKEIYGGSWSWDRRPIIVDVGEYRIPGSLAGMPHGSDFIKGNNMSGHFDVHFLKSKTHGTNRINPSHQRAVAKARTYLNKNSKSK